MPKLKKTGNLRDEEVKRLRMKRGGDNCNCYTVNGIQIRYCDKHRPNRIGTHGRRP